MMTRFSLAGLARVLVPAFVISLTIPLNAQESPSIDLGQRSSKSGRSTRSDNSSAGSSSNSGSRNSNLRSGQTTDEQQRATTDRNDTRERNSRRPSRNASPADPKDAKPGTPAVAGSAGTKKIEGSKPAAKKSGGSASASARGATTVEFKMTADPQTNILFVDGLSGGQPTMNLEVPQNKQFTSRVALSNPRKSSFKSAKFALKYDPAIIKPVAIDDTSIADLVEGVPSARVEPSRGIIYFDAAFSEARLDDSITLARIVWEPIAPTAFTRLTLLNSESNPSGIYASDGKNILHIREDGQAEASAQAGLLGASVSVMAAGGTAEQLDGNDSFSAIAMTNGISNGTLEGGVSLSLKPRASGVQSGQTFLVDVLYNNPNRAEIDTVQLKIKFDPNVLQVEDYDTNNWITRGVNILDGPYQEDLPFDFHRKNTAFNSTGEIYYDMGFSSKALIPAQGTIATIRFRAIEGGATTPVVFDIASDSAQPTRISFLGFDLIGEKDRKQAFLNDTSVTIR